MSVDKLVDSTQLDADLTSVANAIRTKGGTSANLAFPTGFISAVEAIETGGGGEWTTDGVANGTEPNGDITITASVSTIIERAFYRRTRITSVTIVGDPLIGNYAFEQCSGLTAISVPNLTRLNRTATATAIHVFNGCSNLTVVAFPMLANVMDSYNFQNCTRLTTADLGKCTRIGATFPGATALRTIILRRTGAICALAQSGASGVGGIYNNPLDSVIYVPSALIASYQQATNWSTLYNLNNDIFQPIEDSIYETQYADGTPIT